MDFRSKRQKLEAMANQTESPHEAKVAQEMLDKLGDDPPRGRKTKPLFNEEASEFFRQHFRQHVQTRPGYTDFYRYWEREVNGADFRFTGGPMDGRTIHLSDPLTNEVTVSVRYWPSAPPGKEKTFTGRYRRMNDGAGPYFSWVKG